MTTHIHSLLCLGDSYTIGEGVALHQNFPYQTLQLLRTKGFHFHAPEIIAKTGWTAFELAQQILHTKFNEHYDFVTLLIGVNNQYRGLSIEDFITDFEFLLMKAIHFTGNNAARVIVLSIPNWGVTPFAKDKDTEKITTEINAYNKVCKEQALKHKTHFINITESSRKAIEDSSLITQDGLHYSEKEMSSWAEMLVEIMEKEIN